MKKEFEIVDLYPRRDIYQVVDGNDSAVFQGSKDECIAELFWLNWEVKWDKYE